MCRETKKISFSVSLVVWRRVDPHPFHLFIISLQAGRRYLCFQLAHTFLLSSKSHSEVPFGKSHKSRSGAQSEHSLWLSSLNLTRDLTWLWTSAVELSNALALGEGEWLHVERGGCKIWMCSCTTCEGAFQSIGGIVEEKKEKKLIAYS